MGLTLVKENTHTHTHTHTNLFLAWPSGFPSLEIKIQHVVPCQRTSFLCVCVCVCVLACVRVCVLRWCWLIICESTGLLRSWV